MRKSDALTLRAAAGTPPKPDAMPGAGPTTGRPAGQMPDPKGAALAVTACLLWGTNFEIMTIALSSLGPWTAALERFGIGALTILALLWWREGISLRRLRRNGPALAALGVLGIGLFNGTLLMGLKYSSPLTAALLMSTTPLLTNLIEAMLGRARVTLPRLTGMVISCAGIAMVVAGPTPSLLAPPVPLMGEGLLLIASVTWAIYTVGGNIFMQQATPLETTSWTMLFGTVALVVFAFLFESPLEALPAATASSHLSILYLAIPGAVLSFLLWNMASKLCGSGTTAIFYNLVPIFALATAALTGDRPTAMQLIGVAVTLGGVIYAQRS